MTTLNPQAAAIKAILESIPEIGVVMDYQPNPAPPFHEKLIETYSVVIKAKRQIRAWTIQYVGEDRTNRTVAIGASKTTRSIRWVIRGHFSWSDDLVPESEFRGLVEAVVTALDENRSINQTALDHNPAQVELPNNGEGVILGDFLCRFVEISLTAKVEQSLATS